MEMSCVQYGGKKTLNVRDGTVEWYTGSTAWTCELIIQFECENYMQYK